METDAALREALGREEDFRAVAGVFRQLSDASRIRIFWLLCHCEVCVTELSAMTGMTSPAVSHHLQRLKAGGLVLSRRQGREVRYRASDSEQSRLLHLAIEKTMAVSCPKRLEGAPERHDLAWDPPEPPGEAARRFTPEQIGIARRVHDLMTGDPMARLSIQELSRRFFIDASTLKACFRAVYGNSMAAHLQEHRMAAAAELLRDSGQSVGEIAGAVGYRSQSKFAAAFRRAYGVSPAAYRRALRQG